MLEASRSGGVKVICDIGGVKVARCAAVHERQGVEACGDL
jgi:hypothetical protein